MSSDLERALEILRSEKLTLAAVNGGEIIRSCERGVKPLLGLIDGGISLRGYCAADKVVGAAAAYLYVLLAPDELYAEVVSAPALEVLQKYGVRTEYGRLTDAIINRDGTGFCPMETAVRSAANPEQAEALIREKLDRLKSKI